MKKEFEQVRVTKETKAKLQTQKDKTGIPMATFLEQAVDEKIERETKTKK